MIGLLVSPEHHQRREFPLCLWGGVFVLGGCFCAFGVFFIFRASAQKFSGGRKVRRPTIPKRGIPALTTKPPSEPSSSKVAIFLAARSARCAVKSPVLRRESHPGDLGRARWKLAKGTAWAGLCGFLLPSSFFFFFMTSWPRGEMPSQVRDLGFLLLRGGFGLDLWCAWAKRRGRPSHHELMDGCVHSPCVRLLSRSS